MAEKTDLKRVQAALDRAAEKSVSGPKEARSGRFVTGDAAKTTQHRGGSAPPPGKRS
jgi:hypothetical protein